MKPIYLTSFFFFSFVLIFLLFPLVNLTNIAISQSNLSSLSGMIPLSIIGFTYLQALLSTVLAGCVGVPLAIFCADNEFFGKKIFIRLCEVTFFMPTLIVVLAIIGVWGRSGWFGKGILPLNLYGWFGVLLAHVFFNFSIFFKLVGQSFKDTDRSEEKISLSLGMGRWRTFFLVTQLKVRSSITQSFVLVFLYCSSSFLILLLLGGGPRFSNLEVAIYQAVKVDLDLPLAICLATIQIGVGLFIQIVIKANGITPFAISKRFQSPIYACKSRLMKTLTIGGAWALIILLVGLPLLNVLISALPGFSHLDLWDLIRALLTSCLLGFKVAVTSLLLAFCATYISRHSRTFWVGRLVSVICTLPISLSTMVFGLAIMVSFPSSGLLFRDEMWGVVCVQTLSVLPLSFRILNESILKIDRAMYFTAESLGANKFQQLFFIEIPLMKRSIFLVAAMAFGISMGEVGAVLLFESEGNMTLPLSMFKLMGKYQFDQAQAIGIILLLVMVFIFAMKEKWENLV